MDEKQKKEDWIADVELKENAIDKAQENHPELLPGEVWLTNDGPNETYFGYTTVRVGEIALDVHGNPVQGLFPVFVSKDEYDKKQEN